MKRILTILMAILMILGGFANIPRAQASIIVSSLTVDPIACGELAEFRFQFSYSNVNPVSIITITFPPEFNNLPNGNLPVNAFSIDNQPAGAGIASVNINNITRILSINTTATFYYKTNVIIYKSAGIRNAPCTPCPLSNPHSIIMNIGVDSATFAYSTTESVINVTAKVDPATTSSYVFGSSSGAGQWDIYFRTGSCNTLAAGSGQVFIAFPQTDFYNFPIPPLNQIPTSSIYFIIGPSSTATRFDPSRDCPPMAVNPPGTGIISQLSIAPTVTTQYINNVNYYVVSLTVPIAIGPNQDVGVRFCKSAGIQNPGTSGYKNIGVYTSFDTGLARTQVMIGNHATVQVLPNSALSQDVEYKITWRLPPNMSLSGNDNDWIEVDWHVPTNPGANQMSIVPQIGPFPNSSYPASSVTFQNYSYGSLYYSIGVVAIFPSRFRVQLPPGFNVTTGGELTITFTPAVGLDNSAIWGGYRLRLRTSKTPVIADPFFEEWIPSDVYSIVDSVIFPTGSYVQAKPPTVNQPAQYTLKFQLGTPGALVGGIGTISVNFPSGTFITSTIGSGSIWLITGPLVNDAEFHPNFDCPPQPAVGSTGTAVQLDLNPTVSSSMAGTTITFTIPSVIGTIASGSWVAVRFCLSAGIRNPTTVGNYNLQIKTSTQPNWGMSPSYRISSTISNITVTPSPNSVCSTRVQYDVAFTLGNSGTLIGNNNDYIDINFSNLSNPSPDFSSIQNMFQNTTNPPINVTQTWAHASSPFVGATARYDISFVTGVALTAGLTSWIDIVFPSSVHIPTTINAADIFVRAVTPMSLLDVSPNGGVALTSNPTIVGNRVRITLPVGAAAGDRVYIRFRNTCNIQNPSAPSPQYVLQVSTYLQQALVNTLFGITNDFPPPTAVTSADMQWSGHDISIVPSVFPPYSSTPAQYDFSFRIAATNPLVAAATLQMDFPPGTVIPSTMPAGSVRYTQQPDVGPTPLFNFGPENGAIEIAVPTVACDPTNRRVTLSGMTSVAGNRNIYIRFRQDAGIINTSTPGANYQLLVTLNGTGAPGSNVATLSEFFVIIPPPIGGVNLPPNSVKIFGGYYYSGVYNNFINHIEVPDPSNPKLIRLFIPPGVQLQPTQQVIITFLNTAGLMNTCTAGTYKLSVKTSQENSWIESSPYDIVDAVQFNCGTYPTVNPPTVNVNASYDVSFTVGSSGGLTSGVDSITVAFPSSTTFENYSAMPAGGIYVSTIPIPDGNCPPPAPAQPVAFPPTVMGSTVTFVTPIPIGNGQTVFIKFCKSAGIRNPYTAGTYTLQVKTSTQPSYAISCNYAIGTAVSNVEVVVNPNSASTQDVQYEIKMQLGISGGLKGDDSDYVDIDFSEISNINGLSITNIFTNPGQVPSASSIQFSLYGYGYGAITAGSVVALNSTTLRIYLPAGFTQTGGGTLSVIFTPGSGLDNTPIPGSYKLKVRTSREPTFVSSKPYQILDAVIFFSGFPVDVRPPIVGKEAQYTMIFQVGNSGALSAGSGTITIAFPTGTQIPYNMAAGSIWIGSITGIAPSSAFANNTCPPTATPGAVISQVNLPPQISGNIITITTPINIPNSVLGSGSYVTIRFCLPAGIKNPITAGSYRLQVKTSTQPAYATSYPYAIIPAATDVKVTVTPNTICSENVAYEVSFKNSQSSAISGDTGGFIEVDFNDPSNPSPDFASISNTFTSMTNAVTNVKVRPLTNPLVNTNTSIWDVSFRTNAAIIPGTIVSIVLPNNFNLSELTMDAGNVIICDRPWDIYSPNASATSTGGNVQIMPAGNVTVPVGTNQVDLIIPAGFNIPANSNLHIRFWPQCITNPNTPAYNYFLNVSTSVLTNPTPSNYFAIVADRVIPPTSVSLDRTFTDPFYPLITPPLVYPSESGQISQIDLSLRLICGMAGTSTVTIRFPDGFTVPTVINRNQTYLSVDPFPSPPPGSNMFFGNDSFGNTICPNGVLNTDWGNPTLDPSITGNTVSITIPAFLVARLVANNMVYIRFASGATIKNPNSASVMYSFNVTINSTGLGCLDYGNFAEAEYLAITPSSNPQGASTISASSILLGGGYGYGNAVHPSSVVVVGPKRLRIYLPLGYTIQASTLSTILFTESAGLINTCMASCNYVLKILTSNDSVEITSSPYCIVAAVSNIRVKVVPPIVNTKASYTIAFTDTSNTGLHKDRDTITIAFPPETMLPNSMAQGAVYVARGSDFTNIDCPATHPGIYGTDFGPLNAPPLISNKQVTLTLPIDIRPGEQIFVRFCSSAGITNPMTAGYYTLQVKTSAQPDFAVSNRYAIVTGAQRPSVKVEPNLRSRFSPPDPCPAVPGCVNSKTTITFLNGANGSLTKGAGRIYVTLERNIVTADGYFVGPLTGLNVLSANSVRINGTYCTVDAVVHYNPSGAYIPNPPPSFTGFVTIEIVTPIDISSGNEIKIEFLETAGICNPLNAKNYSLSVWTSVETAAVESEPYSIVDGVWVVGVDVQPPTISSSAQYTIQIVSYSALSINTSNISVTFPDETLVPSTMLPGHIYLDDDTNFGVDPLDLTPPRAALNPVFVSSKTITFTMPFDLAGCARLFIRFSLESGLKNPSTEGSYRLKVRTSSQPVDVVSPYYNIVAALSGAIVTVKPPVSLYQNAEYVIDFDLSTKGGLTGHVSFIRVTFPSGDINGAGGGYASVESQLPSTISPNLVTVNGLVCTEAPTVNLVDRTITIIVPQNIEAGKHITVDFQPGAGMRNPISGSYRLRLQTSIEPIDIETEIFTIQSGIGGPLFGRNPVVAVSYLVASMTLASLPGANTVQVDTTIGWKTDTYAVVGDLLNMSNNQIIYITGVGVNSLTFTPPLALGQPVGTRIFSLKSLFASTLTGAVAAGAGSIQVVDASGFVNESYLLLGPDIATAELMRITGVDVVTDTISFFNATANAYVAGDSVFRFVNNIGLVNNESYYGIIFQTGSTGNLTANISNITITFPLDTIIPSSILPTTVQVSSNGITYQNVPSVTADPKTRILTFTTPINIPATGNVYVRILSQSGIRNPSMPGTYRLRVHTDSEPTDIDSLAYYMEGTGAPSVSVDPCTIGEVGARYTIKFHINQTLPQGSHIFVTFPQDTILPSILRQEYVKVNGMPVINPINVTTATLTVDITTPKQLLASSEVFIELVSEARIKNPSSPDIYRLKVRTDIAPDDVDVESLGYYICPKQTIKTLTLIPSALALGIGQSGTVQAQAKDEYGNNITYNVNYVWSTDIGSLSGATGDTATITAPSAPGSGTLKAQATYQGETVSAYCPVTVTAPLGSVSINPSGTISLGFNVTQVFSATAKDTTGATLSGATFKWTVTGGVGSINPSTGSSTTLATGAVASVGTISVESTYAGVTRVDNVTVRVEQGGGGGGGGGGGSTERLISAVITPSGSEAGSTLNYTITISALKDITNGEIRITIPIGWQAPTSDNFRLSPGEGVSIGSISISGQTVVMAISSMQTGRIVQVLLVNYKAPDSVGQYTFTTQAKNSAGDLTNAEPMPVLTITPKSGGGGGTEVDGSGICSVTPTQASAGATGAKFTFTYTARADISGGIVQIKIPTDWTPPTDSPGNKGQVKLINTEGEVVTIHMISGGIIEIILGKMLANQKFTFEYTNVDVPAEEKIHVFNVLTSGKSGSVKLISNPPQVTVVRTAVTNVTCTPKPNSAGGNAQYVITLRTSESGTLIKDQSTIIIQFPSDTSLPPTIGAADVKIQGVPMIEPAQVNQSTRTVILRTPTDVPPNQSITIDISINAGIKNPTQPRTTYKITLWTSSDGSAVQSNAYNIEASAVSPAKVTPDPVVVNVEASYTITFTTGGAGRLSIADDQIVIKFPPDTLLPAQILTSSVTINGKPLTKRPDVNSAARKVSLPIPDPIPENGKVTIVFDKSSGIKNPTKAGNYKLIVSTTKETMEVDSEDYGIGSSTVTGVKVSMTSKNSGATCIDYTVEFTTGQFGALTPASTITIEFHPNYKLSNIEPRRINVNGMGIADTPEIKQGRYIVIKVPGNINAGSNVRVNIQCLDNPTTAGTYHISAQTSAEPTLINSNDYMLGETLRTDLVISPANPNGDNGWYNTKPSLIFSNNVSTATTWVKIDGGAQQRYTGAPIQLGDGTHNIEYWSEAVGFESEQHQTLQNIKIDTIRPEITIIKPDEGEIVGEGLVQVSGTYTEENILEVSVTVVGSSSSPTRLTLDRVAKTYSGTIAVLTKGKMQLDIKARDEAGNTSLYPVRTIEYNPDICKKPALIVLNPKDNQEPLELKLNPITGKIDEHNLQMKVNVQGTAECVDKIEVSSDAEPGIWVQISYDAVKKNFNGDVTLKAKAGSTKITVKATDTKTGKSEIITKTLLVKCRLDFVGIKGFNPKTDKAVKAPTKTTFNDTPVTNISSYAFLSVEGRTYVPFRLIGNAFGAKVSYDDKTRTATYEWEGIRLDIVLGAKVATLTKGGIKSTIPLDSQNPNIESRVVGGRLYVPLRIFGSAFGWKYSYNGTTKTVSVWYP